MRLYNIDVKIEYLPYYLAIPMDIVLLIVNGYLIWWLVHGVWPSIAFLIPGVMLVFEVWEKTKIKKEKILSIRKVDPL